MLGSYFVHCQLFLETKSASHEAATLASIEPYTIIGLDGARVLVRARLYEMLRLGLDDLSRCFKQAIVYIHFVTYFVFEPQVPRQSVTYCVHKMKLSLQHAQPAQASNLRRPARRMHACVPRATAQTENKATLRQPRKENTAGDFYVDHTCIGMRPLQLYVTLVNCAHKALAHTGQYLLPAQLALSILLIC